jgi:hypothetical protein
MESNYYDHVEQESNLHHNISMQEITTNHDTKPEQESNLHHNISIQEITTNHDTKPEQDTSNADSDNRQSLIQNTLTVSNSSTSSVLWICMVVIALIIYKMRKDTNTGFNGYGVLLCILCCPHLYVTYVLVDLFIN